MTGNAEWQPIATAPSDDTHVLACDDDGWMNVARRFRGDLYYYAVLQSGKGLVFKATWWMALPEPPKKVAES